MKKKNIWSVDFRTYQLMIVEKWKNKHFVWHSGHLQFLKYSYLASIYWRLNKKRKLKKDVRYFYQNHFMPQTSLHIFDKPKIVQISMF